MVSKRSGNLNPVAVAASNYAGRINTLTLHSVQRRSSRTMTGCPRLSRWRYRRSAGIHPDTVRRESSRIAPGFPVVRLMIVAGDDAGTAVGQRDIRRIADQHPDVCNPAG
jgi:hypothetical protein